MIYFIDFDGTICPNSGYPSAACRRVIRRLKECNHTVVIYSCRSNPNCVDDAVGATQEMEDFLKLHEIPYDRIEHGKPFFNYIIDDRCVGTPLDSNYDVDWEQIEKKI
jgi:hypothetical protein